MHPKSPLLSVDLVSDSSNSLGFYDDSEKSTTQSRLRSLFTRRKHDGAHHPKSWKPRALRPAVLIFTTLVCWALITVLQILLTKSERDGGILFAPNINDLPLSRVFMHRYFPTILAVIFSIFWSWIDLETKRMEPYYQMSKKGGALGKDSLLLHYPFDFIPVVPLTALRNRHWSVLCASIAVLFITWGIVPIQAGIFATVTVTRAYPASVTVSDGYLPSSQQAEDLSLKYAQSVYGIVTQNETLPAFMARTFALAPFKSTDTTRDPSELWTANTTLYSLDIQCEEARTDGEGANLYYIDKNGCRTLGLHLNQTIGNLYKVSDNKTIDYGSGGIREFSTMYVGYWGSGGYASYYIENSCPDKFNNTFYVGFAQNKEKETDPPKKSVSAFCHTFYYQQEVNATINAMTRSPQHPVIPLGPKIQVPDDVFNITLFETQLNSRSTLVEVRKNLPTRTFPRYSSYIAELGNLTMTEAGRMGGDELHPMAGLAILSGNRTLQDYLDIQNLQEAYESAYRITFSRAMYEILDQGFTSSRRVDGRRQISTQAVALVSVFTYLVEGLLGLVSAASLALLYFSTTRKLNLRSDPSTFASVMSLTADEEPLLRDFQKIDAAPVAEMHKTVGHKKYELVSSDARIGITELESSETRDLSILCTQNIAKPVNPIEFRSFVAVPFLLLHLGLAVALAVLFVEGRTNGFPLPSDNKIVQNIIQNYIPTVIATMIEPVWIMVNRAICLLQQLEELRRGKATAKRSIDLDYASLPPQLVIFKALRSRHIILAAVCSMTLLANVLAVAFADLFNQDTGIVVTSSNFRLLDQAKFVSINGSLGPQSGGYDIYSNSGAWNGGDGEDQFLVAESNFTRNTSLPAWTDHRMMYLPFATTSSPGSLYSSRTKAFGGRLECTPLSSGRDYTATLGQLDNDNDRYVTSTTLGFNTTVRSRSGNQVNCSGGSGVKRGRTLVINPDFHTCYEGRVAAEFIFPLSARENATREESDTCADIIAFGWTRNATGSCEPIVNRTLTDTNTFFVRCTPKIVVGEATVLVNSEGRLQQPAEDLQLYNLTAQDLGRYFSNDPQELLKQSNQYMIKVESSWHNDTFSSQFINYFIRFRNGSQLLDPAAPLPTFSEVQEPLESVYAYLSSIWLGINRQKLLLPYETGAAASLPGKIITSTKRLFISTTMFYIAEVILCCYTIVAILVYFRRPGQYLARLPTNLAAIIALFAASAAVQDMKDTSTFGKKARSQFLEQLGSQYGYGSYVGSDGRVHVGIEKVPLVKVKLTTGWWRRKTTQTSRV